MDRQNETLAYINDLILHFNAHKRNVDKYKSLAADILEREREKVNSWLEGKLAPEQKEMAQLEVQIASALSELDLGARKSVSLPNGIAGFRKQPPQFFFNGEPADGNNFEFVMAIKQRTDTHAFIKYKETLDWASLKRTLLVETDGTVTTGLGKPIPGLTFETRPDKLYVSE